MRTSNRSCRELVNARKPFKAHQMFAENIGSLYVVFSYGYHWPMWVYDRVALEWIGTDSRYSPTTSRQSSLSRPSDFPLDGKRFHIDHLKEMVANARQNRWVAA